MSSLRLSHETKNPIEAVRIKLSKGAVTYCPACRHCWHLIDMRYQSNNLARSRSFDRPVSRIKKFQAAISNQTIRLSELKFSPASKRFSPFRMVFLVNASEIISKIILPRSTLRKNSSPRIIDWTLHRSNSVFFKEWRVVFFVRIIWIAHIHPRCKNFVP